MPSPSRTGLAMLTAALLLAQPIFALQRAGVASLSAIAAASPATETALLSL